MVFIVLFLFFFFIVFIIYCYSIFLFKDKSDCQKLDTFFILYKKKVKDDFACVYWDDKEKTFYFNSSFFSLYKNFHNYYVRFFGFLSLKEIFYSADDFHNFTYFQEIDFSCLFTYITKFIDENFFKKTYRYTFIFSFFLFILVFLFFHFNPSYISDNIKIGSYNIKYFLLFFLFSYTFYNFFFILKDIGEGEFVYASVFVKFSLFLVKFIDILPTFLNTFFSLVLNLLLIILVFNYFNYMSIFPLVLAVYSLIIVVLRVFYEFCLWKKNQWSTNEIVIFLSSHRVQTILILPIGTILLFVFYKIYWWLYFFIYSLLDNKLNVFIKILLLYVFYSKLEAARIISSWYNDEFIFEFLLSIYWFDDYRLSLYYYVDSSLKDDIKSYLREKQKLLNQTNV